MPLGVVSWQGHAIAGGQGDQDSQSRDCSCAHKDRGLLILRRLVVAGQASSTMLVLSLSVLGAFGCILDKCDLKLSARHQSYSTALHVSSKQLQGRQQLHLQDSHDVRALIGEL